MQAHHPRHHKSLPCAQQPNIRAKSKLVKTNNLNIPTATKVDQSDAYNQQMKKAMGWKDADPYQYHYDRGLYYHEIVPDLICGSQPRHAEDITELKEEVHASTIINVGMHCSCCCCCWQSKLYITHFIAIQHEHTHQQ